LFKVKVLVGELHTSDGPEIAKGLLRLVKLIAIGKEETAVCMLHPFALTVTVPAFSPLGVRVIEVVVLVPVQPEGNVHV